MGTSHGPLRIRPATEADAQLIVDLIGELADYEKLRHDCRATPEAIRQHLFGRGFGRGPVAECVIGEVDGVPQGFALFFTNFSTFMCKPGIYLEDLFVRPSARGKGLGKALLKKLAQFAIERGCGRVEWSVLDWNTPAIDFYKSLGAIPMDEWTVFRLTGEAMDRLGAANS